MSKNFSIGSFGELIGFLWARGNLLVLPYVLLMACYTYLRTAVSPREFEEELHSEKPLIPNSEVKDIETTRYTLY